MKFDRIVPETTLTGIIKTLSERNIEATVVKSRAEAMEKIKSLIPRGASVMNGSSRTLEEIGFVDYLKSETHGWNNLHEGILAEKDPAQQSRLRKLATLSDYYVGSVHAIAEDGQFIIASNTGSQMPHVVYSSPNLIFVVGAQKVTPTLTDAMQRLEEYVVPRENERMQKAFGMGTQLNKVTIFKGESSFTGRKVHVLLVQEKLGF